MTRDGDIGSLLRLIDGAEIADNEDVQALLSAAAISQNRSMQKSLRRALSLKAVENIQDPFTEVTPSGRINLGQSSSGSVCLKQEDLMKHLLAVGQSGSGKTTLFYSLMDEVEVSFWSFDLKQDYRHLSQDLELLVLPWNRLKFNPLRPPEGVSPRRWAQVFAEIFGHATSLLSGSKNYLLKKIVKLYRLYGLFDRVEEPFPSLHELELLMKREDLSYARKTSDYRDTVLNRLEAMNLVAGTVFDCSMGYPLEQLLEQNVVFELDGLNRDVQNFLMEILFAYVYEYRLSQGRRDQGLSHLFFLDEAKRVFSVYKERQAASGIPEIDELTAKMREFGEGLVVADQEASKLTDSIKANTYTKLLLSTGDRKQFQAVTDSMNLSQRQAEYAQKLGTGEAVVQVGSRDPVPVKLENYELEKTVSDRELEARQAENWNNLSYKERDIPREFKDRVAPGRSEEVPEPDVVEDPSELDLSSEADRLLEDVIDQPFKALTKRYNRFSSSYKGNKAKNELVDQGVVVERKVHTQNGKRKLLELTDKGRDYVENQLDVDPKHRGRGGVIHRYWQTRIQESFENSGWTAEREMFDADIYVNMGDTEVAVEVAMGNNPREIEHVEKHLNQFDTVWITCRNQEIRDGLQQRIQDNDLDKDRVVFRLFRDFNEEENLPS